MCVTGRIPRTTPTSPAPAAAALHHARHFHRLPARAGYPQRRADLRSKPSPGTHHEHEVHDAHTMHVACPCTATVFSVAYVRVRVPAASTLPLHLPRCVCRAQRLHHRCSHSTQDNYSPSPSQAQVAPFYLGPSPAPSSSHLYLALGVPPTARSLRCF
jgi:hypothetical protein